MQYDKIIIGGGLYGLWAALRCGQKGQNVIVLEYDDDFFERATYINQARVHMGYHYPRSFATAIKSAHYFDRFNKDYADCILSEFEQVYATSSGFSWTNAEQFKKFCQAANIKCEEILPNKYFKEGVCDGAFLTTEYTYDAKILKKKLLSEIEQFSNVTLKCGVKIKSIEKHGKEYVLSMPDNTSYTSGFVLNATYAAVNQINQKAGFEPFKIKYELCEIILCKVNQQLDNVGLTVMDGPFFSIMPFGKTGYHSLTSVTFTPHLTSYDDVPIFSCQDRCREGYCTRNQLGNCNECVAKPNTSWEYMSSLARKYMRENLDFEYMQSLFSMKPILKASEIDDSRPTVIKEFSSEPVFVSVLSGKINTVYDLEEVLFK